MREVTPNVCLAKDQKQRDIGLCETIEVDGQLELAKIIATVALCRQKVEEDIMAVTESCFLITALRFHRVSSSSPFITTPRRN